MNIQEMRWDGEKMEGTWYIYFILLIMVFLIYLPRKKRKKYVAKNRMINKNEKERAILKELMQSFVGKDVFVKLLEGNADGIVKEVTDGGMVLENKNGLQILNLDYIIKIREYPYKNGKRATLWGE